MAGKEPAIFPRYLVREALVSGETGFEHAAAVSVGARLELLLVEAVGSEQLVLAGAAGFQDEAEVAQYWPMNLRSSLKP